MKFATIWTIRAMTFGERLRRTGDWAARQVAASLPARIRYWVFVQQGAKAIPSDATVPEVYFVDVLQRVEGGPS